MKRGRGRIATHAGLRLRRAGGVVLALVLLASLTSTGARASTKSDLEHAKARLAQLEKQIAAERDQLAKDRALLQSIQGSLNEMATQIDQAQTRYDRIQNGIMETRQELARAEGRYQLLRTRLDERARYAYENGPAGDLEFILGSSSLAELSDRVAFIGSLARNDADLANAVQNRANDLEAQRKGLERVLSKQAGYLKDLQETQAALDAKFAEQQHLYDQ